MDKFENSAFWASVSLHAIEIIEPVLDSPEGSAMYLENNGGDVTRGG